MGVILKYKVDKISLYPYGGIVSFNAEINKPLIKDFLVLISGPVMQFIGYLILRMVIVNNSLEIYHYSLLFFNLLPIYPLDGGKLLNIICSYRFNYMVSFYITFIISIVFVIIILIVNLYHFNMNLLLMMIVLIVKIFHIYRDLGYYYQKFLLERYLHQYHFNKRKYITSVRNLYRDCEHIINFEEEKKVLKKYFIKKIE